MYIRDMPFLIALAALNTVSAIGLFLVTVDGSLAANGAQVVALLCFAINTTYLNWRVYVALRAYLAARALT